MNVAEGNRVLKALEKVEARMIELSRGQVEDLDATMSITFEEHFEMQNTQAWAFASGIITQDEANVFYAAFGEVWSEGNGGWTPITDTATKCTLTVLMKELLERKLS